MYAILFEQLPPLKISSNSDAAWRAALCPLKVLSGTYSEIWAQAKRHNKAPVLEFHETEPSKEVFNDHFTLFARGVGPRDLGNSTARTVRLTSQAAGRAKALH